MPDNPPSAELGTHRDELPYFAGRRGSTRQAIAHGVLAEDSPGAVSFGIPSFHGYMVELGQ